VSNKLPDNVVEGMRILTTYDPDVTENHCDHYILAVLTDYLSTLSEEDEEKMKALGWQHDDREVWSYNYDFKEFEG